MAGWVGDLVSFVSPCASLAWGLLLLCFNVSLLLFGVCVCSGVVPCVCLLWAAVAFQSRVHLPFTTLVAECCRLSTILTTLTTLQLHLTHLLTQTHSTQTQLRLHVHTPPHTKAHTYPSTNALVQWLLNYFSTIEMVECHKNTVYCYYSKTVCFDAVYSLD